MTCMGHCTVASGHAKVKPVSDDLLTRFARGRLATQVHMETKDRRVGHVGPAAVPMHSEDNMGWAVAERGDGAPTMMTNVELVALAVTLARSNTVPTAHAALVGDRGPGAHAGAVLDVAVAVALARRNARAVAQATSVNNEWPRADARAVIAVAVTITLALGDSPAATHAALVLLQRPAANAGAILDTIKTPLPAGMDVP